MKIIQKGLTLLPRDYYLTHLSIINSFLPTKLTEKEIQVLAGFLSLDKSITDGDMFNTYARKIVKDSLQGMSSGSLSNYLSSLIAKGFLEKNEITKRITVKEFLLPEDDWQGYQFKIIKQTI